MTIAYKNQEMQLMVDLEKGTVNRRIFSDQDIYELELEQIFARAWNFMAHDSQIPNPGDFFMTFIGEDRVIVARDNDGDAQVLVNTCRHRGNAICRAEEGHATSFMCTYHGWTYDLKGALVGVPGFKEVYHEELDRENWGLIKAAQVDSYKGFIFANMDPEAPNLDEYLGEVGKICVDMIAMKGDMQMVGGVQKYTIPCNWKFATDNVWDYYHSRVTHGSAFMTGISFTRGPSPNLAATPATVQRPNLAILGEYGHALAGPMYMPPAGPGAPQPLFDESWRERPEVKAALGVATRAAGHPHVFPNFWVTGFQVSLRIPKGPSATDIWWFTFIDKDGQENDRVIERAKTIFGPAGMLEQDDGENWGQSTRGAKGSVTQAYPLNYSMGLGRGEVIDDEIGPPHIETIFNEHAQLWHYRAWSEWMSASDWPELKQTHSQVPLDRV